MASPQNLVTSQRRLLSLQSCGQESRRLDVCGESTLRTFLHAKQRIVRVEEVGHGASADLRTETQSQSKQAVIGHGMPA